MNKRNSSASKLCQQIEAHKVVAILRGDFVGVWTDIGGILIEAGITDIEVTLTSPGALDAIRELRTKFSDKATIGAGTVLSTAEVDQAIEAGAQFIVAPNVNLEVIQRCTALDVLSIPGAFTATEIEYAYRMGAGMVKVFPSAPVGPSYIKALRGPFAQIPLVCTGGISPDNAAEFLAAGANAVGITTGMVPADMRQSGALDSLRDQARRVVESISKFR
jgi:2-dehydro-3-deoxyphosphogluconate aldolase/(4S)-4-hydroxy-2-oxoglutarate aldolase